MFNISIIFSEVVTSRKQSPKQEELKEGGSGRGGVGGWGGERRGGAGKGECEACMMKNEGETK